MCADHFSNGHVRSRLLAGRSDTVLPNYQLCLGLGRVVCGLQVQRPDLRSTAVLLKRRVLSAVTFDCRP